MEYATKNRPRSKDEEEVQEQPESLKDEQLDEDVECCLAEIDSCLAEIEEPALLPHDEENENQAHADFDKIRELHIYDSDEAKAAALVWLQKYRHFNLPWCCEMLNDIVERYAQ